MPSASDVTTDLEELKRLAAVGAFEPGRNGNYGYAHDPADESRNQSERDEARIKVCAAVPDLISRLEASESALAAEREKVGRLIEALKETTHALVMQTNPSRSSPNGQIVARARSAIKEATGP
jgi:hypothetical protein